MTLADRQAIAAGLRWGMTQGAIADFLGRCKSVISREISPSGRGRGGPGVRADRAWMDQGCLLSQEGAGLRAGSAKIVVSHASTGRYTCSRG
ncbi:MAG: helix-turn-helix domain-containing protein [Micrococcales bacterium]|nr:helix-turn-helix domain-containing protein [Micrococcales bacterium]